MALVLSYLSRAFNVEELGKKRLGSKFKFYDLYPWPRQLDV